MAVSTIPARREDGFSSMPPLTRREFLNYAWLASLGFMFLAGAGGAASFFAPRPHSPLPVPAAAPVPTAPQGLPNVNASAATTPAVGVGHRTNVTYTPEVNNGQRTYIDQFLGLARQYMGDAGDINVFASNNITALPRNNDWFNAPALAYPEISEGHGQIYIYAQGLEQGKLQPDHWSEHAPAHEYRHIQQGYFAGIRGFQNAPEWLREGDAEYRSWRLMDQIGRVSFTETQGMMGLLATADVQQKFPLQALERTGSMGPLNKQKYNIGFMAVDYLVSISSQQAVDNFWRASRNTNDWHQAFQQAFNINVTNFYRNFDNKLRNTGAA